MIKLYKGDCLIESDKIENGSVDLILTDLPYGNMNTDGGRKLGINGWDLAIEPKKVYEIANRILRKNGKMVLFSQEPYTTKLINKSEQPLPFNYRAVWEKDNYGNALGVNVNMVGFYEDILIFSKNNKKYDRKNNNPLRYYFADILTKYGKDLLIKLFINEGRYSTEQSAKANLSLKFGQNKTNFEFMTNSLYEYLKRNGIKFCKTYEELKEIHNNYHTELKRELNEKYPSTFNLWEGKKYKSNILKYKKDYDGHHPTQKPVLLLEDLIKTFSNENDLVVDLTMGSGSTGVACKNTNRDFIGIEMNDEYFKIAEQRINDTKCTLF
ncbi:MAG: site-specific DNA-methyltransferase [Proteobacteria bacterium]|nr:site-specific DNA-methyltransferase [Pseudomonadota bacterium]